MVTMFEEGLLKPIAALRYVMRKTGRNEAGEASHEASPQKLGIE